MSRPCSPCTRTGTPASHAGTLASSAARLRVCTIAGEFAEQPEQPRIEPDAVPRPLVQRDECDVVASDALAEIGDLGQRHHHVAIRLGGSWLIRLTTPFSSPPTSKR